jgi:4'-phosphopantetheinyl transferase
MADELEIWTVPSSQSEEALPYLLSRATAAPQTALVIKRSPRGKPFLASHPDVHFSVSNSGELYVVAITRAGPVGVDIERIREVPEAEHIARRWLHNADPGQFFEHWTRREAHLKAIGMGLSGLDEPPPGPDWRLGNFVPAQGYLGAWAVQATQIALSYRNWTV